ncbi:MAG: carbamoyltransferase C-terminal domain-containing protein, partial [Verrucomicrobiota bacterium]
PAAGDSGGALGAALFVWYQLLENERLAGGGDSQNGSYLGPEFTDEQITSYLDSKGVDYRVHHSEDELVAELADHLADQKIVGWFQGRMEFGPRALGARSILGDPRGSEMQKKMNLKIKFRESFRPFAPSVLRECAHDFFNIPEQVSSPYMLLVGEVNEEHRCGKPEELKQASGFEKLSVERSDLPAVTHVDYSARIQTLDKETHPLYYKLIKAFEALTGCPLLVNTSFNVRGEPIVCTPDDAFNCFMATEMDLLVMGNVILHKDQIDPSEQVSRDDYLSQFRLD